MNKQDKINQKEEETTTQEDQPQSSVEDKSTEQKDKPDESGVQIEKLLAERQELKDRLLRQMAENENVRTRNLKSVQETRDYAILGFAKDMISIMDNLSRALEHVPEELDDATKNIIDGVKMTHQELVNAFKKNNIDIIAPKAGDKFDYNVHCAISQQEAEGKESGVILSVMQQGYKIKDRLIRAASVVVSK